MSTATTLRKIQSIFKKSVARSQINKLGDVLDQIDSQEGKIIGVTNIYTALQEVGLTLTKDSYESALTRLRKKNEIR